MVDSDNKVALNILCDLYALSTIEADRALVDGARPAVQRPLEGDQPRGLLAVPPAASDRRGPRRRVRDPAGDAARGDARGVRQPPSSGQETAS